MWPIAWTAFVIIAYIALVVYADGDKRYITEVIIPQVKGELFVIDKGKGWDVNESPGSERGGRGTTGGGPAPAADQFDDDIPF